MNSPTPYPSSPRAWLTVGILMLAYVLSFVDRQILNLLVGPIKADLGISDTQMSLLMGLSFALFYTLCGIPLGRLADNANRKGLIAAGIFVWSIMTAACGLAKTFWGFFFARVGVGAGEAALSPSAYSMIADSFPPNRRATAISVYSMGIYIGSGMAFLLGGLVIKFAYGQENIILPLLGEVRPWQYIFVLLGIFGIMFCLLFLFLKEPARQGAGAGKSIPFSEVLSYIKQNRRAVSLHNLSFACVAFCSYGAASWVPTFFVRTHGMTMADVGFTYGTLIGIFGSLGIIVGGRLSDTLASKGYKDAPMRVAILAVLLALPSYASYVVDDLNIVIALTGLAIFALSMPFGVAAAAIQEIMPNPMRGQASALYLFVITIIGLGIGPTAVALITDKVFGDESMLRYSLLIVSLIASGLALALLMAALKPYRESLDRLKALYQE